VPVPELFRFGEQVTRPEPLVHVDQELTRMTLLILHDDRELHKEGVTNFFDEMHDFRLRVSLKGWPEPLNAAGECSLLLADKPSDGSPHAFKATTSTLDCGIDCDGGRMSVERVAGMPDVTFRFDRAAGGLRMSGGCGTGSYHVGGDAKPYDEALQKARKPPVAFRLSPMPQKECAAFRKKTNREN
jgi:hypothetical protein